MLSGSFDRCLSLVGASKPRTRAPAEFRELLSVPASGERQASFALRVASAWHRLTSLRSASGWGHEATEAAEQGPVLLGLLRKSRHHALALSLSSRSNTLSYLLRHSGAPRRPERPHDAGVGSWDVAGDRCRTESGRSGSGCGCMDNA